MPNFDKEHLNKMFMEAEGIDSSLFSEQRSNILLVTGNHYSKRNSRYLERLRDGNKLANEAKIRLTRNHINKITKIYINNIINNAPGVQVLPKNQQELSDQKAAEMHQAVWTHIMEESGLGEKIASYAHDFVEIGECFVKIFWDTTKGKPVLVGENFNELTGELEQIQMLSGQLVFEKIFAFNLLRDPAAECIDDARWLISRKMVDKDELMLQYEGDSEKQGYIQESSKKTYTIFDGQGYTSGMSKGKVLIREYYWRPCITYPQGWYVICTEYGILEQGELPGGIFPIVSVGFDRIPTSPRYQSIIKQLRPFQAELNRVASAMATHQVTIGDDKILIQAGTKVAQGGTLPGIRAVQYTGTPPIYMPGRAGEQYLNYMLQQISEMYQVANLAEDLEQKQPNLDPYSMLFVSIRNKKKFSIYSEKFERFLKEICETALRLYKHHVLPQALIPAVSKHEIINIPVFKSTEDLDYEISIKPSSDDVESVMGRQLAMNQVLQYVGGQLDQEMIGQLIRNMPFANKELASSDLTVNYDNAVNTILALDRGDQIEPSRSDDPQYMIKKLNHRTKLPDFRFLPPQVQQNYQIVMQTYEQMLAQMQQEIAEANLGRIPTGGNLIGIDFYVQYDATDPTKSRRARVPFESIDWLLKQLEKQGFSDANLQALDINNQADIAKLAMMQQEQAQAQNQYQQGQDLGL